MSMMAKPLYNLRIEAEPAGDDSLKIWADSVIRDPRKLRLYSELADFHIVMEDGRLKRGYVPGIETRSAKLPVPSLPGHLYIHFEGGGMSTIEKHGFPGLRRYRLINP